MNDILFWTSETRDNRSETHCTMGILFARVVSVSREHPSSQETAFL
jgi:hypothetical protein